MTTTKNKSCGHDRKYMITEAVLHICPVSQYKTEIGGGKKRKKKQWEKVLPADNSCAGIMKHISKPVKIHVKTCS